MALAAAGGPAGLAGGAAASAGPDLHRYEEKAAVVLALAQYVEWPAATGAEAAAPFVVGVLGDDDFRRALERALAGQQVAGRSIRVRGFRNLDEVEPSAILVIGRGKARLLPVILDFLADSHGVLTVGERDDFAERGGVVRLLERDDRIAFEINRDAARAARLRIGSQLLRLAERVLPPAEGAASR